MIFLFFIVLGLIIYLCKGKNHQVWATNTFLGSLFIIGFFLLRLSWSLYGLNLAMALDLANNGGINTQQALATFSLMGNPLTATTFQLTTIGLLFALYYYLYNKMREVSEWQE